MDKPLTISDLIARQQYGIPLTIEQESELSQWEKEYELLAAEKAKIPYKIFNYTPTVLKAPKLKKATKVEWRVGQIYNGGIILDEKGKLSFSVNDKGRDWYNGFAVPEPIVPDGFRLVPMNIGLNLNAYPPLAQGWLYPL